MTTSTPERTLYECCPLCNSVNIADLRKGDCSTHPLFDSRLNTVIQWKNCLDCSHIFTEGYYTKESCSILFGKTNKSQVVGYQVESDRFISFKMVDKVLPYVSSGLWLDVGFGNGSLLFTAQEYGFTPVGLDLRSDNVKSLTSMGIESYCSNIEEISLKEECAVVSMADVLEHIPFPRVGVSSANKLLRTGGVLIISMPNTDSIVWRLLDSQNSNPYWGELEHYHNFSRTTLYCLLADCGFRVQRFGVSERYRACMEVIAVKV